MGIVPVGNSGRFPQEKLAATESRYPTLINYKVHAGSFRVFIIHRTLTWATGYLTCVRDLFFYALVYTRGLGTPTASQHNIFYSENLSQLFFVLLTGFEPQVFGSRVRLSTNWATPSRQLAVLRCSAFSPAALWEKCAHQYSNYYYYYYYYYYCYYFLIFCVNCDNQ